MQMSTSNGKQPRQVNTDGNSKMPCFPLPRSCAKLKPCCCPLPAPPCNKKTCKIMPTDDAVFHVEVDSEVCVKTAPGDSLDVTGSVKVCWNEECDHPVPVFGQMEICNCCDAPFHIEVDSDVCVKNAPGQSLDVKVGWNEECDHPVPVFGQMEICNCCDTPLKMEISQSQTATPLCVAIENKSQEPLCIQSVSSIAPIARPKCISSCQFALEQFQTAPDIFELPNYLGGKYPLICAAENQLVRIKQIKYRFYSKMAPDNTTAFASESFLYLESDGATEPFLTADTIGDLVAEGSEPVSTTAGPPSGTTCGQTNPPPQNAFTHSYCFDMPEQFGAPLTLTPNDTAVLFYEVANPLGFPYYAPIIGTDDLQNFDLQTKGCCEPAPSCFPAQFMEPVPVYIVNAISKTIDFGDATATEEIVFCTVDCFGKPIPSSALIVYTVTFEYSDSDPSAFETVAAIATPLPDSNKYAVQFPDIPQNSLARFTVTNESAAVIFATQTDYTSAEILA